jgi:hypothetical protein
MEKQILLTMLSPAAAALAASAGLAWHSGRRDRDWPAIVALALAVALGARLALETWPRIWPAQATEWWVLAVALACLAALAAEPITRAPATARRVSLPALAGSTVLGAVMIGLALRGLVGSIESASVRLLWQAGGAAAMILAGLAAATPFIRTRSASPRFGERLCAEHWSAPALTITTMLSAPALLFSAHSMKLMLLGLALSAAWIGVGIMGMLGRQRLATAAAIVAAGHIALWLIAHLTSGSVHAATLGAALAGPAAGVIGTLPPVARRGGWFRVGLLAAIATALGLAPLLIHGPEYLRDVQGLAWVSGAPRTFASRGE